MAKMKREYRIRKWKDFNNYICNYCDFRTLDLAKMQNHIQERHRAKPKKEPVKVPIYDRFGNLIKYREA
jgi:predicted methyltransferase